MAIKEPDYKEVLETLNRDKRHLIARAEKKVEAIKGLNFDHKLTPDEIRTAFFDTDLCRCEHPDDTEKGRNRKMIAQMIYPEAEVTSIKQQQVDLNILTENGANVPASLFFSKNELVVKPRHFPKPVCPGNFEEFKKRKEESNEMYRAAVKYKTLCENNSGWYEKAKARYDGDANPVSLFFWWFFKILPSRSTKITASDCDIIISDFQNMVLAVYNNEVEKWNDAIETSKNWQQDIVPYLEDEGFKVVYTPYRNIYSGDEKNDFDQLVANYSVQEKMQHQDSYNGKDRNPDKSIFF